MPFDLDLPAAVEGGDAALGVGELVGAVGAQVGDSPGVAVDLGRHPVALLFQDCLFHGCFLG